MSVATALLLLVGAALFGWACVAYFLIHHRVNASSSDADKIDWFIQTPGNFWRLFMRYKEIAPRSRLREIWWVCFNLGAFLLGYGVLLASSGRS
jgi:hypothetical protein